MDQTNQPTSQENPDELVILEEGPSNTTARSQARSYECNFCKRGFSNAQALGGHMNIHRKDKAKLKRRRSSTLEIPNSTAPLSDSPLLTNRKKQPLIFEASDSSTRTNKYWPWKRETRSGSLSRGWDDADVWEFQLMPNLFVDRLSSNQDHHHHHHQKPSDQVHGRSNDSDFSSSSHGLPSLELDLELRLGSEPLRGAVSPSRSTIKFF